MNYNRRKLTERLANDMQGPDNLSMYSEDRDHRPSRTNNRSSRFDSRNNSDMQRPPRPKFNLHTFGKDVEQYTIDEFVSTMDDYVKPFALDSNELRACIKSHLTGEAASVVLDRRTDMGGNEGSSSASLPTGWRRPYTHGYFGVYAPEEG